MARLPLSWMLGLQHSCAAPQATAPAGDNPAARPCAPGGPRRTRCSLLFCGSARRRVCACESSICTPATTAKRPIPFVRGAGWAPRRAGPIRGATCVDIGLRVHEGDIGLAPQRGHGAPPHTCCQLPLARPCGTKPPPRGLCHVHPKSPRQQATSTFGLALASGSKGCNSYGQRGGRQVTGCWSGRRYVRECMCQQGGGLACHACPCPSANSHLRTSLLLCYLFFTFSLRRVLPYRQLATCAQAAQASALLNGRPGEGSQPRALSGSMPYAGPSDGAQQAGLRR